MNAFKTALRLLTRFPVETTAPPDDANVLACFPVVGALLGAGMWLAALILVGLTNAVVGSLIAAVCLPALLWWVADGKNLRAVIWFLEQRLRDDSPARPVQGISAVYWRVSAFQAVLLLKLLCTGLIVSAGYLPWLLVTPILSFAAFAQMCRPRRAADDERSPAREHAHWIVAAALVLIVTGLTGEVGVGCVALIIALLLVPALERVVPSAPGAPAETGNRAAMEFVEQLILLLGVLHFIGA